MYTQNYRSWVVLTVLHNDQSTEEVVVDLQEIDYIRPSSHGGCYAHLKSGIHLHLVNDLIEPIKASVINNVKSRKKTWSTSLQTTSVDNAASEESSEAPT